MPLAWAELRLVLAYLLFSFDIGKAETVDGVYKWEELLSWQLMERRGFEITLWERTST
jgi:hypothetical protein